MISTSDVNDGLRLSVIVEANDAFFKMTAAKMETGSNYLNLASRHILQRDLLVDRP